MTPATHPTVDAATDATRVDAAARVSQPPVGLLYRSFRRTTDVVVSFVGLVCSLPLFLVVAAIIATSSRGPVFFSQERVGLDGKRFLVVKFRTMRQGTDREVLTDPAAYEAYVANGYKLGEDDPRITRIGRWLRKTSLDELPQLVNVLAGQMSVVGVRPLVPDEFAARAPSDRALYVRLRPGLTGLWQIAGRSSLTPANRIELDREYLRAPSIRHDLAILCKTPAALSRTQEAH
ncbi:sugar transferase [Ilumatobacter fluminis]|nr:sugar transferase [Ilumatobacter fluminis]